MNFNFNDEELAFQEMAANFAQQKLSPHAAMWDETEKFPVDTLKEAAKLGMAAMVVSEDIGGSNLSRLSAALIFEKLAQGCISTTAYLSIHNMVLGIIDKFANNSLRQTWGLQLSQMNKIGSYCLTEPNAGSDAASLQTKAHLQDDYYIINGAKAFISGAGVSDVYLCMVRTGSDDYTGISCLLVEKDAPGISFGKPEKKMGWRSQPTRQIFFENCKVPCKNLIGSEGEGFKIALSALNGGRINIAACSLGGAALCLNITKNYMAQREQFATKLKDFQALRFYFADMLTKFNAAQLLVYKAATKLDNNDSDSKLYTAMAKRYATDVAFEISHQAMQIHGGYGYLQDYQIERVFRDLRVHQILEGTNEIMKEVIAKETLDKDFTL